MIANQPNNLDNQEIDLSQISEKINGFFDGIRSKIYHSILYFKKNSKMIILLFVLGFGLGIFLDTTTEKFNNELVVIPNFESTDYLYSKIDLISSKIKEEDTVFLKSIGILEPKNLIKIKVAPIIDLYSFINKSQPITSNAQSSQNFELVKLLSEDGDIKKVVTDEITSKNYANHKISIKTSKKISNKNTIEPLLKYLNTNEYFNNIKDSKLNSINIKIAENQGIIDQINGLMSQFSSAINSPQKSDKLVYYNENTQLNDVLRNKDGLISETAYLKLQLIDYSKIVRETSSVINIKDTEKLNNKLKFLLPFLFIFIFIFIGYAKKFIEKEALKAQNKTN
jgi:hypothetical protein